MEQENAASLEITSLGVDNRKLGVWVWLWLGSRFLLGAHCGIYRHAQSQY